MGSAILIRVYIFLAGFAVVAIGIIGSAQLGREAGAPFLLGAMTLGGGLIICGLFTLRMLWHGVIGAGVLALLGLGRGILNSPDILDYLAGKRDDSGSPLLELIVTLICVFVLLRVIGTLSRERTRRMLAGD